MNASVGSIKRTLYNFFSVSLLQIGNYVLPIITLPIISRIIGPERYGVINYAFAFAGYFILLINAGFDYYGTRMIIANREDNHALNKLLSEIIFSKTFLLVVSAVLFFLSVWFIPQLKNEKLVAFYTFLICIGWVVNPSWLYHGMQDSRKYALFSFLSKLIFSVLIVMVIKRPGDYFYHPLFYSLSHVVISLISFYYALKKYGLGLESVSMKRIGETLKENKHLSIIWWITNQSLSTNIIIAGLLLSTVQIGYYSSALRVIVIIQSVISMPLNTVLFPYIGEAFLQGNEEGMERINRSFPYIFMIAFSMFIITFLFSDKIILILYGQQFKEAIGLLRISSTILFFATLNSAFGQQVMLNLKKDESYVKIIVAGFVFNIILLLVIIFPWGIDGAAWAWPVSETGIFIFYVFYFRKRSLAVFSPKYYSPKYLYENTMSLFKLKFIRTKG